MPQNGVELRTAAVSLLPRCALPATCGQPCLPDALLPTQIMPWLAEHYGAASDPEHVALGGEWGMPMCCTCCKRCTVPAPHAHVDCGMRGWFACCHLPPCKPQGVPSQPTSALRLLIWGHLHTLGLHALPRPLWGRAGGEPLVVVC